MFFGRKKAPELKGLRGIDWINSEPLRLKDLKGKVILLDFWAYSCVNCIRTIPLLKAIWERYKGLDFMLIGVHTPEFGFEKETSNLKDAVKDSGITYPVVNDPLRINWKRYGNRYWPRCAVIDGEGKRVFEHIGESGYSEVDRQICEQLRLLGHDVHLAPLSEKKRTYIYELSRETYAGSLRNEGIGSMRACTLEGCAEFIDPGSHVPGVIYPQGNWEQTPEYLEFLGGAGYVAYSFFAAEVNLVADGVGDARVFVDQKPLSHSDAGSDVAAQGGDTLFRLSGPRMYNIFKSMAAVPGELRIFPPEGFRLYAYTFG